MRTRRALVAGFAVILLAAAGWLLLHPRAAHDPRLVGIWQDRRLELQRVAAGERATIKDQGSWLELKSDGAGRQVDYNRVTLRTETAFRWRTEEKDGRQTFFRSYEAAGEGPGVAGRSGEVAYTWALSPDGKQLTLKGQFGGAMEYDRITTLPDRAKAAPNPHP